MRLKWLVDYECKVRDCPERPLLIAETTRETSLTGKTNRSTRPSLTAGPSARKHDKAQPGFGRVSPPLWLCCLGNIRQSAGRRLAPAHRARPVPGRRWQSRAGASHPEATLRRNPTDVRLQSSVMRGCSRTLSGDSRSFGAGAGPGGSGESPRPDLSRRGR